MNGVPHGMGKWTDHQQTYIGKLLLLFLGQFVDGKRSGKGKFVFLSGNVYQGDFKNDLPDGPGKIIDESSKTEKLGFWREGKLL